MAQRALSNELFHSFQKLESRRVLSVNAAFANQILDITINAGGNTDAALLVNGNEFFVDADADSTFDNGVETSGLLTALQGINVNGIGVGGIGTFLWQGNFSTSNALANLNVNNVLSVTLGATASLTQNASINTINSVAVNGDLAFDGSFSASASGPAGQITNGAGASLIVDGQASFNANTINLGSAAGDDLQFGSLNVQSSGSVSIQEDATLGLANGTRLVGSNTSGSFDLISNGPVELDVNALLSSTNQVGIQALGVDSDVTINGDLSSVNGDVTIEAADSIFMGASGSIVVQNNGDIVLEANSDLLNGNSNDLISMSDGGLIQASQGTIRLTADGVDGGSITLGSVVTSNATASAIEVSSTAGIVDGTAGELANLSANAGRIRLITTAGGIGAGVVAADIDLDAFELVFQSANNAAGIVQITDLAGGVRVAGLSSAGGVGFLAANSPLTISADINLVASFTFTAGNSGAAGDDLTINNNAIVTLNSAVAGLLTFDAGDDIVFATGRIVTTGAAHSVLLRADREDLGADEGNLDGDRGGITQDGLPGIEVTTTTLTANAGEGINLDTQIGSLSASNSRTGNITVREFDGLTLTSVINTNGSIDVSAAGLITATSVAANGAGSNATISTTTGGIAVSSVTANNNVTLSATAGNITSGTIQGTNGFVSITATNGDVTIGSITAGTTVTILTPAGSINDAQNDALVDISAGGAIALTARDEIGGLAADGRLELAAGSVLTANSTTAGDIFLRGLGALTLTSVTTANGAIDVIAAGNILAHNVSSVGTDTDANDVRLNSTTGDVLIRTVEAGPNFGDVTITAQLSIGDNDIVPDSLDVRGNDIILTATNGSIGITSTNIFVAAVDPIEVSATNNLTANALNGVVALDASLAGTLTLNSPTAWVQSNGDLDASALVLNVTNLALIADADKNGTGTLTVGNAVTVLGDLRLEGEDVVATDGTIDLQANRLLFFSGTTETIRTNVQQMDVTIDGTATIQSAVAVELIDLDRDNVAVQTLSATGNINVDAQGNILVSDDLIAGNDLSAVSLGGIVLTALTPNANILINDVLWADEGAIEVRAENDILVGVSLSANDAADTDNLLTITTNSGNIRLVADADADLTGAGGALTMVDGTRVIAGRNAATVYNPGANGLPSPTIIGLGLVAKGAGFSEILVSADEDVTIGSLQTANEGLNAIRVTSFNRGIVDAGDLAGDPNLIANFDASAIDDTVVTLRSVTGTGHLDPLETQIDQLDTFNQTSGDIRINEVSGGGNLELVGLGVPPGAQNLAPIDDIKIQVDAGSLIVSTPTTVVGGNILLAASSDVVIDAIVTSTGGHVSVIAGDDIDQNANISAGQTVYFSASNATADAIVGIDMANGTSITTNNGNVRLQTLNGGNVRLGLIDAGAGDVSIQASGSIVDANDANLNIAARFVQLVSVNGSIGEPDPLNGDPEANVRAIDTTITTLAASSSTGIYILESNGVEIGDTGNISASRVNFDSTTTIITDLSREDLVTTNNGNIQLVSTLGNITVQTGSSALFGVRANGSGNILLRTLGAAGDLILNARIESGTGHVTLYAGDDIDFNSTLATGGSGTVLLYAINATADGILGLDMSATSSVTTGGGNVHAEALNGGNILLGRIDVGNGRVYLNAANSILDANAGSLNVVADRLAMIANAGFIGGDDAANGTPDINVNAIDTQVAILAAQSVLGTYVLELDNVAIDSTGPVAINRVNVNSTLTPLTFTGLEDLRSAGPIKLQSTNGTITVNAGPLTVEGIATSGASDILLQTMAASGDIVANAPIVSLGGNISLVAGDDVDLNSTVTTSGFGNVVVIAANGTVDALTGIDMSAASTITANNNVLMTALNGGDIRLGFINASGTAVSLNADRSIIDANGIALNVFSDRLRMVATTGSIGANDALNGLPDVNVNAIDTQVNTLAARSATGIYILETNGVVIGDTLNVPATRVNFNSTQSLLLDAALEDLTTTNNGPIKLALTLGNVIVTAGALGNPGISAQGTGDVLLQTFAADGDIIIDGLIQSGTGDISFRAADDIDLNSNVATSGLGTIFFSAANATGDLLAGIDMLSGTTVSNSANIHFVASNGGDIRLSEINGGAGRVFLSADGSIIDVNGAALNVTAGRLGMVAVNGRIGNSDLLNVDPDANLNAIDTSVDVLAARAALGIYVLEANTVSVDDTDVITVRQVNFNSTEADRVERLEDLRTTTNGPIKLRNLAGDIVINPGVTVPVGVSAGGAGDVLLQAARDLEVRADIQTVSGNISLIASDDLVQQAAISAGGAGSILMIANNGVADALSGIDMIGPSTVTTTGQVQMTANNNGSIRLGRVNALRADLFASNSILDANAGDLNVAAQSLAMRAISGTIGGSDVANLPNNNTNAIDTQVETLAASAALGIYVRELDGVTIGDTGGVQVTRSFFNSTSSVLNFATLEDLTTINGPIKLLSQAGSIVVNPGAFGSPGVSAGGNGDVLLQTIAADGDITINAIVQAFAGNIAIRSADDAFLNANVRTTSGAGTILIVGSNGNAPGATNGVVMSTTAVVSSFGGDVSIVAGTAGDILLNQVVATNRSAFLTAGNSIVDINAAANNITSRSLSMTALAGAIGEADILNAPDANLNAIDTRVEFLASRAATGIYILEADGLTVQDVVNSVEQVNFNSTRLTIASTNEDLVSNNGPIKLLATTGNLVINAGAIAGPGVSVGGAGDILIQTLNGTGGFIDINSVVSSGTGNISLRANGLLSINGDVSTGGLGSIDLASNTDVEINPIALVTPITVSAASGNILVQANRDIEVGQNATVSSGAGDIGLRAGRDVFVDGAIVATAGDVFVDAGGFIDMNLLSSITAGNSIVAQANGNVFVRLLDATSVSVESVTGSILDDDGGVDVDIRATNVRLRAAGTIGTSDGGVNASELNALDIAARSAGGLSRVAAQANNGVFVHQTLGSMEVGRVDAASAIVTVNRVNFNSTTIPVSRGLSLAALDDLTSAAGEIHASVRDGSLRITDGADADNLGVDAQSHIILVAQDQGAADATIGNLTNDSTIRSVVGNVTMTSRQGWINNGNISTRVIGDLLTINSDEFAFVHNTFVNRLRANVGANGSLSAVLGQAVNGNASGTGIEFLNGLTDGQLQQINTISGDSLSSYQSGDRSFDFASKYAGSYGLFIRNGKAINVESITAAGANAINVYVETFDTDANVANDTLTVTGTVATNRVGGREGGIVLVAGSNLVLAPTGVLEVVGWERMNILDLNTTFYDGGDGVGIERSTEFVLNQLQKNLTDLTKHRLQQVALEFGNNAEVGFEIFLAYADGRSLQFNTLGEEGVKFVGPNLTPVGAVPNDNPLVSSVVTGLDPNVFVFQRDTEFDRRFLAENALLRTVAVIRRADDFFLFQNANDSNNIQDLTVETSLIENVKSIQSGAVNGPPEVSLPKPSPIVVANIAAPQLRVPDSLKPPEIEFVTLVDKPTEVAIFRVTYLDKDMDGQADDGELPTYEAILASKDLDAKPLETVPTKTGGKPTPEDVEVAKQKLLNDPNMPSGAYSVIEIDPKGAKTVIDVFSVRDFEDGSTEKGTSDEDPIQPESKLDPKIDEDPIEIEKKKEPEPEDGATLLPAVLETPRPMAPMSDLNTDSQPRTRFASTGLFLGALWLLGESQLKNRKVEESEDLSSMGAVGYSRSDRRRRRSKHTKVSE